MARYNPVNEDGVELNLSANAMRDLPYRVTCKIQTENWTKELLDRPIVRIAEGQVEIPPSHILPGQRDVIVARKTAYTATGTYGTVSWLLERENRRVVVMWVAPFNFDFYDNWLAVGMTSKGIKDHAENDRWYKQMYYEEPDDRLQFRKMKYKNEIRPVIYEDDGIKILGTMSTTHNAQVKINIRPLNISDYADNIKHSFS